MKYNYNSKYILHNLNKKIMARLPIILIVVLFVISTIIITPINARGSVELKELIELTTEEAAILETMFNTTRKIDELKLTEETYKTEINDLQLQIASLNKQIASKQLEYAQQLKVLEKVLVSYQRGGFSSYIEMFFNLDNLSDFLKSLNIIKDISQNLGNLLTNLKVGQTHLINEQASLNEANKLLVSKQAQLQENIKQYELAILEQTEQLAALQDKISYYETQLAEIEQHWLECKKQFVKFLDDMEKIIDTDFFEIDDSLFTINFFSATVTITEANFNKIIKNYSNFPETKFYFDQDNIKVEFFDKQLILNGNFKVIDDKTIEYQVTSGTFYGLPMDLYALNDLFVTGPMQINFNMYSEGAMFDFITDFAITNVTIKNDSLIFKVKPIF